MKTKDFYDDSYKMADFFVMTKKDFLSCYSYLTTEEYNATNKICRENLSGTILNMTDGTLKVYSNVHDFEEALCNCISSGNKIEVTSYVDINKSLIKQIKNLGGWYFDERNEFVELSIENLYNIVRQMNDLVHDNVSNYQTDAMTDITYILEAMAEHTLPKEAYWLTRTNGTYLGFGDERMLNTLLYDKAQKQPLVNEQCYKIFFERGKIESMPTKEFFEEIRKYSNSNMKEKKLKFERDDL